MAYGTICAGKVRLRTRVPQAKLMQCAGRLCEFDQRDTPVPLPCQAKEDLNRCNHDVEGAGCVSQKSPLAASWFDGSMTVPVLPSEFPIKVETL